MKNLTRLCRLANLLDDNGFYNDARAVDSLILKRAAGPRIIDKDEEEKGVEKVCRNCKKTFKGSFQGWHNQFCPKCKTSARYKEKLERKKQVPW